MEPLNGLFMSCDLRNLENDVNNFPVFIFSEAGRAEIGLRDVMTVHRDVTEELSWTFPFGAVHFR